MNQVGGGNMKTHFINHNRNNRVKLRNFAKNSDWHDLLKTQIVRMLRRKHRKNTPIYTEYNQENPNESYPDISMRLNGANYIWELQHLIDKKWIKQITEKYENDTLIIVDLKFIYQKWLDRIENNYIVNHTLNPMDDLRTVLESDYAGHDKIII